MIEARVDPVEILDIVKDLVSKYSHQYNLRIGQNAVIVTVDQPMADFLDPLMQKLRLKYGVYIVFDVQAGA